MRPVGRNVEPNCPWSIELREAQRQILKDTLAFVDGNVEAASKFLGIKPNYFYFLCKSLGGVMRGELKREPWKPLPYKTNRSNEEHNEELDHADHDAEDERAATPESTDSANGESAHLHTEQAGNLDDADPA